MLDVQIVPPEDLNSPLQGKHLVRALIAEQGVREAPEYLLAALAVYEFNATEIQSDGLPALRAVARVVGRADGVRAIDRAVTGEGDGVLSVFRQLLESFVEQQRDTSENRVSRQVLGRYIESALGSAAAAILEIWSVDDGRTASSSEGMVRLRHDLVRSINWWLDWVPTAHQLPPAEVIAMLNAEYQHLGGMGDGENHPSPLEVERLVAEARQVLLRACALGLPEDPSVLMYLVVEAAHLHLLGFAGDARALCRVQEQFVVLNRTAADPLGAMHQLRERLFDEYARGLQAQAGSVDEDFAERELELLATTSGIQTALG